jgi:diguanylate cyclase (GGDEF)-like protein
MSVARADRAQRDRRLIVRAAALLSQDYPLGTLVARLCDALAYELRAELGFAALAGDGHAALRVAASAGAQSALLPPGSEVAEGSAAHASFETGAAMLVRSESEFEEYLVRLPPDACSGLFVPIVYGDRVLGVFALLSAVANAFDEEDLRLLEAIARYVAIAVRNARGDEIARKRRSPLPACAAIAALTLLLSVGFGVYVAMHSQQMATGARAAAASRLHYVAANLADHLDTTAQLVATAATFAHSLPHDTGQIDAMLLDLLRSTRSAAIFGVGVWYEPYAFSPRVRLFGPYASRSGDAAPVLTMAWSSAAYDYPSHPWYRLGIDAGGKLAFTDPYFDTDHVYFTAVRAFRGANGRFEGVVTVDTILQQYEQLIGRNPLARSLVYVTARSGSVIMTSQDARLQGFARQHGVAAKNVGTIPRAVFDAYLRRHAGSDPERFSEPLPYAGWTVRLAVDRRELLADARRFAYLGYAAIALLWVVAGALIVAILKARRQADRAIALELQQHELAREIAERKRAEERLRERAFRDELTRLPNRAFMIGELQRCLESIRIGEGERFAVLFIDLDRFNVVNDSLGHHAGDMLLGEIAQRLCEEVDRAPIARLGGDEFIILVAGAGEREARQAAEGILAALRRPFTLGGRELFISASIGIALAESQYSSPEEMLRDADAAMYEAKRCGRSTYRIFDQTMHTRALEALSLETDLRWGLERNEFYAVYQPIVSLADERVVGFEALARWTHPARGLVEPESFIPLAEHTGLIVEIDECILRQVCKDAGDWLREYPGVYVSVNASAAHLARTDDLAGFRRIIEASGVAASALRIELTETAVMESRGRAERVFSKLRQLGIGIMVDDFGTGYSSLAYLQHLPIEGLKIDRSFVNAMLREEKANTIVHAIVAIAQALQLRVIAEGIETREEVDRLRAIGLQYGQGYYFSEGLSAAEALNWLRSERKAKRAGSPVP